MRLSPKKLEAAAFFIYCAMRTIIFTILAIIPSLLPAQLHDNTWLMGYAGGSESPPGDIYGISVLSFLSGNVQVTENTITEIDFDHNNSAFSDSSGQIFAYCNGLQIENVDFQVMENGQELDQEILGGPWYQWYSDQFGPQGTLFLPWPEHPDSLLFIYSGDWFIPVPGWGTLNRHLSFAVIDRAANNGLGKVVAREQSILEDTISKGQVTACRHANGRDWWIMTAEHDANRFYRTLIDPQGIHVAGQQTVSDTIFQGLGQSCFSPDGRYFAAYNAISSVHGSHLNVFDFDRCSGTLSNQRQVFHPLTYAGGLSFSPNSRFLYENNYDTVYQYDLQAANFFASQKVVAIRDEILPYPYRFYQSQLAPDGKIYTSATNGMKALHVIHRPDEEGDACQYQQRGLALPTINAFSVPNFPNYRLGPLDGSSCDTLGLDNLPLAWWRYEQDTLNPNLFAFLDLSYYEPSIWSWDFGDGTGNSQRHPVHEYAQAGAYQVCLTVSNVNSSSTLCKTLQITVSAVQPAWIDGLRVGPSPFRDHLRVALDVALPSPVFRLYDPLGRLVRSEPLGMGMAEIDTGSLPAGIYFWEVTARGKSLKTGRCIKTE